MTKPSEKRLLRSKELYNHDCAWEAFGTSLAGMDEAGRGPLLGPVVARLCDYAQKRPVLPWIDDSKKLSAIRREAVMQEILEHAIAIGIGEASAREIDEINILNATRLAMQRAAAGGARNPLPGGCGQEPAGAVSNTRNSARGRDQLFDRRRQHCREGYARPAVGRTGGALSAFRAGTKQRLRYGRAYRSH